MGWCAFDGEGEFEDVIPILGLWAKLAQDQTLGLAWMGLRYACFSILSSGVWYVYGI